MSATKLVNLSAYRENLELISKLMKPAKVMAVIKADAYGHGALECAYVASQVGIEILGTLDIETAKEVRARGISTTCFAWLHSLQSDFAWAIENDVELSVGSFAELETIASNGFATVHLKFDSGLSRNGVRSELWGSFIERAMELESESRIRVAAIWTHLSGATPADDQESLKAFDQAVDVAKTHGFTGYRHAASSPAAFSIPNARYEMVRIGVSAFGTSPIEGVPASELGLGTPMSLNTTVTGSQEVGIGYLHGYFSKLSGIAWVVIDGQKYRVLKVGELASKIEAGDYRVGMPVLVFGPGLAGEPTAEELCELTKTVTDELFTGIKSELTTYTT